MPKQTLQLKSKISSIAGSRDIKDEKSWLARYGKKATGETHSGLTPLGKKLISSARDITVSLGAKHKPATTADTADIRRKIDLKKKQATTDSAIIPAVNTAASRIASKNKEKLKRMSRDITRGTPAANPNPFRKK